MTRRSWPNTPNGHADGRRGVSSEGFPPAQGVFAEFRSNHIQGRRQPVWRRWDLCWLIKKRQLLDRRLQPIDLQRQACQAHPSAQTPVKETVEDRLKIGFPAGAMRQSLLRRALDVVAMPDRKPHTPTDSLLLSKGGAEDFQQSIQPSE